LLISATFPSTTLFRSDHALFAQPRQRNADRLCKLRGMATAELPLIRLHEGPERDDVLTHAVIIFELRCHRELVGRIARVAPRCRSEEHTSELQSRENL